MDNRMSLLWASDGSEYCLSTVETMRHLVLPAAAKVSVVTVAPLNSNRARLKRLVSSGDEIMEQELARAREAAIASERALLELHDLNAPVTHNVRWGSAATEIVQEGADLDADIIAVGTKPYSAFRRAIMDDTALAVLKLTHRATLLARPPTTDAPRGLVILCNSSQWLSTAVDFVKRLQPASGTKVYLASFVEQSPSAAGMFFSYREYKRLQSETVSVLDHQIVRGLIDEAAVSLRILGHEVEVVIGEGSQELGLSRLVDDVSAGAVVVGAAPFAAGFFSSTASALNAALRVRCSVLVAR